MKKLATLLALVLASAALVACGGDDDSTTIDVSKLPLSDDVAGDAHIRYVADRNGELAFRVSEASASAGEATLELVNSQSVPHALALEGPNGETIGETEQVIEGITSTTVKLKPGEYLVYCPVPGHRKAGMKGHLTVWQPERSSSG